MGLLALPAPSYTEPGGERRQNGELVISRGRGMHLLGFVPLAGGLKTHSLRAPDPVTNPHDKPKKDNSSKHDADRTDSADPSVVRGPGHWKRGRPVYEFGNYKSYYGYRYEETDEDQRLAALAARLGDGLFRGLDVLDVGCNSGAVSLAVAQRYRAKRVVGVDIDEGLVEAARLASLEVKRGNRTEFRAEDFLSSPLRRPPNMEPERFDVILCFSVTKWVHFAKGDRGIRNLFKRVVKRLRSGGLFILEPQDWQSYKKKRHLTQEIRQNVAGIELRPEAFSEYLSSLGLVLEGTIEPPEGKPKGFSGRRILFFRRPVAADMEAEGDGDTVDLLQNHKSNGQKVEEDEEAPKRRKRRGDIAEDPPKLSKRRKDSAEEDAPAPKPRKKRGDVEEQ